MTFGTRVVCAKQQEQRYAIEVKIGTDRPTLGMVNEYKYMGVIFENELNFEHFKPIKISIVTRIITLKKVRYLLSTQQEK